MTLCGELDGNRAAGNGGGAFSVSAASLTLLDGAALRGNAAAGNGGGLFVGGAGAVLGANFVSAIARLFPSRASSLLSLAQPYIPTDPASLCALLSRIHSP